MTSSLALREQQITTSNVLDGIMNIGVTYTGQAVFGTRMNLAYARDLLSQLDQTDVLRLCALLNAFDQISAYPARNHGFQTKEGEDLIKWLLDQLLYPNYHARALEIYKRSAPRSFSPLVSAAINGVIGLACRWCPKEGGHKLNSIEHGQKVTRVLFALQEAMLDKEKIASIGDAPGLRAAFPYVARSILANRGVRMGQDLGRLHALVSRSEVGLALKRELHSEQAVNDWFIATFGLSATEYQCVVSALAGYAVMFRRNRHCADLHLNLDAFLDSVNAPRAVVQELLQLAQTTPEEVISNIPEPKEMADAVYSVDHLIVYPLLRVGNRHLVTSFEAVFCKFIRNLPYLGSLVAERRRGRVTDSIVKGARSGFGHVFEGYAGWLAHEWFDRSGLEIIQDYRIRLPGSTKGHDLAQRDLLLIHNDVGYAIETKAKVPPRSLRRTGDLEQVVQMVLPQDEDGTLDRGGLVVQARTAAEALSTGSAFLADKTTPIKPLNRVIPIGLVFEDLPLRFPFTRPFEADVERLYGKRVFQDSDTIAPIQFFDIQSYEEWDDVFDMALEAAALLSAIQKRAATEELRYERLEAIRGRLRADFEEKPGVVRALAEKSEHFVRRHCGKLS